jgi:ribosomal protein S18 acetylase RimI-like enzyme
MLTEECYAETKMALSRQLKWDSELVLVAEMEEQVVGLVIGTIDNNRGVVYRMLVEEVYQRRGIGSALIEALIRSFIIRKVSRTWVTADEHNEPALPFYRAIGFRESDFFKSTNRLSIVAN